MAQFDGKKEATGIVLFFCAIALMLMFYLPDTVTGTLGSFIKNVGFGFIGVTAYVIPMIILYAAIDFFFEKRAGVSKVRVRSVMLLLICISAFLALISNDFTYISTCVLNSDGKASAIEAIKLFWVSGGNSELIRNPLSDSATLPGGILGGGIACALNIVLGKTISILAVVVFFIAHIILVFQISIKSTAKKTAKVINNATSKVYQQVKRQPQQKPVQYYRPQNNPQPVQANSRFVNNQGVTNTKDPFNTRIPIDGNTGFIDVSDREFGADLNPDKSKLKFGERQVDVTSETHSADFSYTALPKNAPLHKPGKLKVPSFLKQNSQKDFINLDPEEPKKPVRDIPVNASNSYENDMPVEVEDDYQDTTDYNYSDRKVRSPLVDMNKVTGNSAVTNYNTVSYQQVVSESITSVPNQESVNTIPTTVSDEPERRIAINENTKLDGYSETEGRIIETNKPETTVSVPVADTSRLRTRNRKVGPYKPAPTNLLAPDKAALNDKNKDQELREKALTLEEALKSFGIDAKVINITHGPAITRFELTIATGIKVSKVLSLQDDIALAMAAVSVRIEAPIPGKKAIGIEIPNDKTSAVQLRGLLESKQFKGTSPLTVALGKDIPGSPILCDLAKMPHLLIAGSTGSGKSVCINTILTSILCKSSPDEVRMILVDPKVVELSIYNGIPHLLMPVVTDAKKAANTLKWAVLEMNRRYSLFAENSVRDIAGYNEYLKYNGEKPLPLILIVIDELADLMTVASKEVEEHISRLAAMARAAGLHIIIATQRPSVDVITGVIKSNIPSRIAFAVSSGVDSRTILDSVGAEKLLGKGDMLYAPLSAPKPVRGQGAFVSDKEVESIVNYLKESYGNNYDEEIISKINAGTNVPEGSASASGSGEDEDELLDQAVEVLIEYGSASVSILQRRLGVGYPRAARLIDVLERKKYIGPFEGSKPRKILITQTDWLEIKAKGGH